MGTLTIVTAPATARLVWIDSVRDELSSYVVDTSNDSALLRLIDRASRIIAAYCNRVFGLGQYLETFRLDYSAGSVDRQEIDKTLQLSRWPVISVESITDYQGTVIDPSLYVVDNGCGQITFVAPPYGSTLVYASPVYPVVVAYHAGYDLLNKGYGAPPTYLGIPPDLEGVALGLITQAYLTIGVNSSVILEVTENVGRTGYDRSSPNAVPMPLDASTMSILSAYKALR